MKNRVLKILLMGFLAAACAVGTACNKNNNKNEASTPSNGTAAQLSAQSSGSDLTVSDNGLDTESKNDVTENSSTDESLAYESSSEEQSVSESSSEQSMDEDSSESSGEVSDESSEESGYDGYYFDDEQIVDDYHTAVKFTDDEEFNALFMENELDKELQQELRDVENETDMRSITISYGEKWKKEAGDAYDKLLSLLEDKPKEKEKLVQSQEEWLNTLEDTENGFRQEADENGIIGTQALLASDSAMLNYYKGRAAKLYQQIYTLSGSFELS